MLAQTDTLPRHAYSLDEAARSISLSRRALYNLIGSGALKTVKLGRRRLVPRDELERLFRVEDSRLVPAKQLENFGGSAAVA